MYWNLSFRIWSLEFLRLLTSFLKLHIIILINFRYAFNKALTLYNSKQYLAAQTLFTEVKINAKDETVKGDCAYYIANAAVRLNQQGADKLMQSFVEEYPTSVKRNDAYIGVADYYFDNAKYAYARKWYDEVDEASLSGTALENYCLSG